MSRRFRLRIPGFVLVASLCCGTSLRAQIQAGSETLLNLDGSISAGYGGSMSNDSPDSHGLLFGGAGNLSGSFHSPQFLSFDVSPFFNQSRDNSTYQSITDASGVNASANLFGGSQAPLYFTFSKVFNSESNYAIPGIANYATNGDTETLGVGWSAHFQGLPTFTVGYQQGSSDYSLYGTQQDTTSDFHSVFGNAVYSIDGFHLSGGIHYSDGSTLFPEVITGEPGEKSSSDVTTYTLNLSRSIALQGNTWVNFTRNTTDYDAFGESASQTFDLLSAGVSLKPMDKLNTQFSAEYNSNLAGSIFESVTSTGALVPVSFTSAPSHSWDLFGSAQYAVISGLYVGGIISHQQQLFLGTEYNSTAFGGSVNYGHTVLGGQFTAGVNVTHNTYANYGGSMLGLLANVSYFRHFGLWSVSGSFNYSQNVQSLLISYTTSGYGYSGSANRRIGRLIWTAAASGSKSVFSEVAGPTSFTQGYSTGLSGRWLGVGGGYSRSSGSGLLTSTGITTLPPGVPPTLVSTILYGGTTYSASVGSTPRRGLTINGSYSHARSNTVGGTLPSNNKTDQAYAYLNYQFRKVYFNAGYSRLLQGFSASGVSPTLVSTYYFGLSRWFKAF